MAKRGRPRKNKQAEVNAELERLNAKAKILTDKLEQLEWPNVPPILPSQERTIRLGSLFTFSSIFAMGLGTALLVPTSTSGFSMKALLAVSALACAWIAGRELRKAMHKAGYQW